ncbi:tripartite-type tricarboxylate transporter receptor subunit TctC [Bradyrhizobium sp. CIR18]|nr:tripartite-type tricarboxylate transporter receptor subunit TctC [Bradyrhizobium sp. CIR18]
MTSFTVTRRTLLGTLAGGLAAGSGLTAQAEDAWPSRMVRLISPYGPGGSNDISLRLLAEEFGRSLRQQFIVENKPGAGTRIANDMVAHAPGDGYTLLYVAAPYATAEALFGKLTYDRKDCSRSRWSWSRRCFSSSAPMRRSRRSPN